MWATMGTHIRRQAPSGEAQLCSYSTTKATNRYSFKPRILLDQQTAGCELDEVTHADIQTSSLAAGLAINVPLVNIRVLR